MCGAPGSLGSPECGFGRRLLAGECVSASTADLLCTSFDSGGRCTKCMFNYSVIASRCGCVAGSYSDGFGCRSCGPDCEACVSASDCVQCAAGLAARQGACVTLAGCESVEANQCRVCQLGFFLAAGQHCEQCAAGCLACSDALSCNRCFDGSLPAEGQCLHSGSMAHVY